MRNRNANAGLPEFAHPPVDCVQTLDFGITARHINSSRRMTVLVRKKIFVFFVSMVPCFKKGVCIWGLPPPMLVTVGVGLTGHRRGLRFEISRIVSGVLRSKQLLRVNLRSSFQLFREICLLFFDPSGGMRPHIYGSPAAWIDGKRGRVENCSKLTSDVFSRHQAPSLRSGVDVAELSKASLVSNNVLFVVSK